ncbi:MAG TPA: VTT domain-containing protein [Candidatus Bathyarchaeia archaeon]|nr:VTT domain-containing protein [Candidatus Bathyarchaeia archaeon]
MGFKDLLKASYVRTSIKLGIILTVAGLIAIWLLKVFNVAATPLFADMGAFFVNYGLAGVFLATILAGTVVPLGSPALVAFAAIFIDPMPLILTASIGFTIGMTVNYALAYKLGRPFVAKRMDPEHLDQITHAWSKWGLIFYVIFGLTPVLPVELLSFICGLLKTRVSTFLLLSFIPRLIVFTLIVYFGQYVGAWIGV